MAKGEHTDLFMIFFDSDGKPVQGESTSLLSSSDPISQKLLEGFKAPNLFEIDRFSMSAEKDDEKPEDIRKSIIKEREKSQRASAAGGKGAPKPAQHQGQAAIDLEINKQVKDRLKQQNGPPVKEISFTRSVDSSSAKFFTRIAAGQGYRSASLIKRKSTGGRVAASDGSGLLTGDVYLRIDFTYVLITEVEWDDDEEEVKEDCKFICREIDIFYRPQLPDGTLGEKKHGHWKWKAPKR